jgi:hypothetical protein
MESRPKTRAHGVVVEELDDGLVVYDSSRNHAHSLDAPATRVWRLADGTRTVGEIAFAAGLDHAATEAALDRLQDENLLLEDPALSRRKLLKRTAAIGAGALAAAPLIETVIIPTAAAHASVPNTPHFPPPNQPGGAPLVLEQPPVVHTPTRPSIKKKKKKKHLRHRRKHHKPPKRPPSFTGASDRNRNPRFGL